ncbi:cell division protein ZipA [Haliea sp.]|uniref:cell division protein ZipA n=1 Tax=Haliea sp. TaxID=1932666 RepID=UPI003528153A
MDLTIRDWMVIAGVLLILAVLLDAWRRVRNDRRAAVRIKLVGEEGSEGGDLDIAVYRELPNGGARVVHRGDLLDARAQHKADGAEAAAAKGRDSEATERPAATAAQQDDNDAARAGKSRASRKRAAKTGPADDDLVSGLSTRDEPENLDWLDALEAEERQVDEPGLLPRDVEPEVFMLNVVARDAEGFRGDDILHILLACDLRFGDMSFFHRHEQEAGRGPIQFSVANMMQPGVFDIDNMSDFSTPGLVFFVTLPGPADMMQAFDYMLETAQTVARNLKGDVLDETRSALTRQTLEHSRQQIRDLERRMLARSH